MQEETLDKIARLWLLEGKSKTQICSMFGLRKEALEDLLKTGSMPFRNRGRKSILALGNQLSAFQESVLVGTLLGDGNLSRNRMQGNARYRIVQSLHQEDYARSKFELFKPYSKSFEVRLAKAGNGQSYNRCEAETVPHPVFTWWYRKFYRCGVKTVPLDIADYLNPVSLAYWFMDDGGEMNWRSSLRLSTNSFHRSDVERLRDILNQRWGFDFDIKANNGPVLRFYKPQPFLTLIQPYVLPSMRYKLTRLGFVEASAPETTKGHPQQGGGIVRPLRRRREVA